MLGCYPTGVTVITAIDSDGKPVGMTAGSFTSVSIDPPLVAFYPAKSSSSFPRIRAADGLCVNVLTADQEYVCHDFAVRGGNKFGRINWTPAAATGAPLLDGALAWLDCTIERIADAGDHLMVLARVRDLGSRPGPSPLVFHRGGYNAVVSNPMATRGAPELVKQLRVADNVRGRLSRLAEELGVQAVAVGATGAQMVILASAGRPAAGGNAACLGDWMPLVAPVGGLFVAWSSDAVINEWLDRRPSSVVATNRRRYLQQLANLRDSGWSAVTADEVPEQLQKEIGRQRAAQIATGQDSLLSDRIIALTEHDDIGESGVSTQSDIAQLTAPIFDSARDVVLMFGLWGLPSGLRLDSSATFVDPLVRAAAQATDDIGGQLPPGLKRADF